jgi:drug/metabolite transporter (DMT)-like permease
MEFFAGKSWFWLALSAAVMWGIGYNLAEYLLKKGMSASGVILLEALFVLPLYALASVTLGSLKSDVDILWNDKKLIFIMAMGALTMFGGNLFILMSVSGKNASLTSLIEISYPIFVILFAWLFFRELHVNLWTFAGAGLILSGVALIYLKS